MSLEYPDGFLADRDSKRPICGVVALAICAGVSLEVATARLRDAMPAHRQRFRGSTNHAQRGRALAALGVRFSNHTMVGNITVAKWIEKYTKPGVVYMVRHVGHVITVKDGMVIDQHRHKPISEYKSKQCRVKCWYEIEGKGW